MQKAAVVLSRLIPPQTSSTPSTPLLQPAQHHAITTQAPQLPTPVPAAAYAATTCAQPGDVPPGT
ncbi:MAG: hypothetical protein AAFP10_08710 [Pseudomonadota bacterium]